MVNKFYDRKHAFGDLKFDAEFECELEPLGDKLKQLFGGAFTRTGRKYKNDKLIRNHNNKFWGERRWKRIHKMEVDDKGIASYLNLF